MLDLILYPNLPIAKWQMVASEQIVLTGSLARLRPPRRPLFIFMHNSGNPACRAGFASAN
jgi:hypothetical protein